MAGVHGFPPPGDSYAMGMVIIPRPPLHKSTQTLTPHRNMFLAAAPYFSKRVESDDWILAHFQSAITSVGTVTNLVSMFILANLQSNASYQKRICWALVFNIVVFSLLALSTTYFLSVSAGVYLAFILAMVLCSSIATGLMQNGAFAFAAGFGPPAYIQAIMTGQAVAGVLPSIAQIVSVLAVPEAKPSMTLDINKLAPPTQESSTSALIYFLTSTTISVIALLAFIPLIRRHSRLVESRILDDSITGVAESPSSRATPQRKSVPLLTLYKKLSWLAISVFMCFAITMFFPVFTAQITSVRPVLDPGTPRLFYPESFIPLAFLFWNSGDLLGRLLTLSPFSLRQRPVFLFLLAISRVVFLPLYLLCNVRGRRVVVNSDFFYLVIVQLGFGVTNGWVGSSCMMLAAESDDVAEDEREVVGAFMGLNLVAGLTAGSLLSFVAAGV